MIFFKNKQKFLNDETEQKDTFVASVVHDLKNPLIAHSRILEQIIKRSNETFIQENCKQLLISTRLMQQLVFSITDTYKYDKGKPKYKYEEFNLLETVKDICLELSALTDEEDLINIKLCGTPIIQADKLHLRRVISNLISNAIKYKKENSNITIEINSFKKYTIFQVTNSGTHIPQNIQKELFKKYVSKSTKFNSHSTGLGLYLSKEIIKGHNGEMFVKSTPNGQNTFGFTIPNNLHNNPIHLLTQNFLSNK